MVSITVRNVSDEVHRALRVQAAKHGRSTEAEIRNLLETAARPQNRVGMGTRLYQLGREIGLTDEDVALIESIHDKTPAKPMVFE